MLSVEDVVAIVKAHGTEASIMAAMGAKKRDKTVEEQIERHRAVFAKLVDILEKKKVIRRHNVVSILCSAEGIPDVGA